MKLSRLACAGAFAIFILAGFNNCSKVAFSASDGALTSGISKTASIGTSSLPTDTTASPSPGTSPVAVASPTAAPSASPGASPVMTGDQCVKDDDDTMEAENEMDDGMDDGMTSGTSSLTAMKFDGSSGGSSGGDGSTCNSTNTTSSDNDSEACETEDGDSGHELGICTLTSQGQDLMVNGNPVVVQFASLDNKTRDVCVTKQACEGIINTYLQKTNGVFGGAMSKSGSGQKFVDLRHHGACNAGNANVKTFTDAQVKAAIDNLATP